MSIVGGLLTQSIAPNYPVILSHRRSSTVSLVTYQYPLNYVFCFFAFLRPTVNFGGGGVGKCFFEESLTNGRCPSKLFLGRERGRRGLIEGRCVSLPKSWPDMIASCTIASARNQDHSCELMYKGKGKKS